MDQTQKIAILEHQVKVLSTFVHAMMSRAPIQADQFLLQMEGATHHLSKWCDICQSWYH